MKQVLVIDESPLMREYLRAKLEENGIDASVAINGLDGISKIRGLQPDLVIMDYHMSRQTCISLLEEKKRNPNTAVIPVIVTAQTLDQRKIIELVNYNVKKVFTKPIRIDALFSTMSDILGIEFEIDKTPCIIEAHVNEDIIFVEIAQGLNREKLDLLRFKIAELLELYEIRVPKVIVMLSDLNLGYADGPNLQKMVETILLASRARHRNIRILTNSNFIRQFFTGRKELEDIEVVANLQFALDGLLSELDSKLEFGAKKAEIIGDRVLSATGDAHTGNMQLKFDAESRKALVLEEVKELGKNLRIAAVDDDFVIQELLKSTFSEIGATLLPYSDGDEFLAVADTEKFDLVFLDLMMPKVNGFQVLDDLKARDIDHRIIVLSAVTKRDAVVKAFQMGVKSYLVKPLKPEAIFRKAMEILRPNF
ncbi:MAG: response regulator [Treponema sp. GWB1_62_6]|nr:MAG: response regulator [Treponema sp. GWA1_62_8]OHE63279.1 MAG: response regulator [Treponema sp. GWB1_62_6]OHE68501.1 MAG: response regulator [Treponema sp. GWC1_61_84]OHE72131.1 MAG: response regulator [Treponema sp. RIFOXYC1_FULL_61_9]HCM28079.1 response regulator [Treponema sp.]